MGDWAAGIVLAFDAGVVDDANVEPGAVLFDDPEDRTAVVGRQRRGEGQREIESLIRVLLDEETGSGEHLGQIGGDFLDAAAGKQGNPSVVCAEVGAHRKIFAAIDGNRQVGEGVAYEFCAYAAVAIEGLLKGEDNQHAVDVALHELDAVFLPCPELRADEEEHGDSEPMELCGELEVNVGEIDEDGERGSANPHGMLEASKFTVDAGQVTDNLGDAHDSHVLSPNNAIETGLDHPLAAHADKCGCA